MMHRDTFAIPPAPLALTIGGLIPFIGLPVIMAASLGNPGWFVAAELGLLSYAAVILSFLGGVRWGGEIAGDALIDPRWSVLTASILGALGGWALVVLKVIGPVFPEYFMIAAGLLALHWIWDVTHHHSLPRWYAGLRTIATLGAFASLTMAWVIDRFIAV